MADAAWQRGYDLEELKRLAEPFKATDAGLVLGAFSGFRERDVAEARAEDRLLWVEAHGQVVAAVAFRWVRQSQGVKDFTGEVRCWTDRGDLQVQRVGVCEGFETEALELLASLAARLVAQGAMFLTVWQESELHQRLLLELPTRLLAVKIPASSELVGVYGMARHGRSIDSTPLKDRDRFGLRRLNLELPESALADAVAEVSEVEGWADHYSSYNKGRSWSALALRGYDPWDPGFIVKPAEMSKGWKRENPERLGAACERTALWDRFPAIARLSELVPGRHQRVRLMRLEPGGGELTRHADITDPEAGTAEGKLLRIHLPLVSNPEVRFQSWTLEGDPVEAVMRPGEAWYLDTRKPHTAVNGGDSPRVHLVVDAYSSPELLAALGAS